MGQQQLLLLVLGIVIVGLAVVVGIQAFGENQKKANQDAMVNDGIRIASDAQAWVLKPTAFGGGNNNPAGIGLHDLGYVDDAAVTTYTNVNGDYAINDDGSIITITGTNSANSTFLEVQVHGPSGQCVATGTGSTAGAATADVTAPATGVCSW